MPRKKPAAEATPDLTSVRTLVKSATKLANHLGLSVNGIYRMIKVNRIPGQHIIKVANFYDVEVKDLLHLTGSDLENEANVKLKSRETLPTLLKVYKGELTLDQASRQLEQNIVALKLIMTHWGDELPTLYKILESLDKKEMSLDQACGILKVAKYTLHGIRRKYGYAPGKLVSTKPKPTIGFRRERNKIYAMQVISGKMSCTAAAQASGVSERTLFRYIDQICDVKLNDLAHWPKSFRVAKAKEIEGDLPKFAQKWMEMAQKQRLILKKIPKFPQTPENWRDQPLKRMLLGVLLGEGSLEEISASRGADPTILAGLFTSDLRSADLTYDQLMGLPIEHQIAFAEYLLAVMDRKRSIPEGAES